MIVRAWVLTHQQALIPNLQLLFSFHHHTSSEIISNSLLVVKSQRFTMNLPDNNLPWLPWLCHVTSSIPVMTAGKNIMMSL